MNFYSNMRKGTLPPCLKRNGVKAIRFMVANPAHVSCSLDEDGNFVLRGGADAQIVQGLIAITSIAVNGMTPSYVSEMSPLFAEEMGIKSSLTPSRANGFLNMFKRVQDEASMLAGGN